jgi:hypothetical protein
VKAPSLPNTHHRPELYLLPPDLFIAEDGHSNLLDDILRDLWDHNTNKRAPAFQQLMLLLITSKKKETVAMSLRTSIIIPMVNDKDHRSSSIDLNADYLNLPAIPVYTAQKEPVKNISDESHEVHSTVSEEHEVNHVTYEEHGVVVVTELHPVNKVNSFQFIMVSRSSIIYSFLSFVLLLFIVEFCFLIFRFPVSS